MGVPAGGPCWVDLVVDDVDVGVSVGRHQRFPGGRKSVALGEERAELRLSESRRGQARVGVASTFAAYTPLPAAPMASARIHFDLSHRSFRRYWARSTRSDSISAPFERSACRDAVRLCCGECGGRGAARR